MRRWVMGESAHERVRTEISVSPHEDPILAAGAALGAPIGELGLAGGDVPGGGRAGRGKRAQPCSGTSAPSGNCTGP